MVKIDFLIRTINLLSLIALLSCERVQDKGQKIIDKSVAKAEQIVIENWNKGIEKMLLADVKTKNTSFHQIFKTGDSLAIKEVQGLYVDLPMSFYYCFLEYYGNKEEVLNYICSLPTKLPSISDDTYITTDSTLLFNHLNYLENKHPEIREKLDFFYEIKHKKNLEYFKCNRYPNAHHIIYDPETNLIYHHFEKYWD